MGKIIHYIAPVMSGKTTFALEMYRQNPERNLIFFDKEIFYNAHEIKQKERIYSQLTGMKFDTIIIDEYLLFYSKIQTHRRDLLYDWIVYDLLPRTEKIILISTPYKFYNRMAYTYLLNEDDFIINNIGKFDMQCDWVNSLKDINYSFIVPKKDKVEVVLNKFKMINNNKKARKELKTNLGLEKYRMLVKAKFLEKLIN